MKKTYYLFNPGRLSRKDNTLLFEAYPEEGREGVNRYLPIETVSDLMVFGSLDANSALYNFLGKENINVHFFDYYQHYTGSFMAKDYLLSGRVTVAQTKSYLNKKKRIDIAQRFVYGAAFNMYKVLKYYANRGAVDCNNSLEMISHYALKIKETTAIDELMGLEGNIRQAYYQSFPIICNGFEWNNRTKQPPENELNSLVSLGNMLCYSMCLQAIYHTQLNPTISFLHEPGERRYSLALDLAEIFKPMLVDRLIFSVLNKKIINKNDFISDLGGIRLKDAAYKIFIKEWDTKLSDTFKHRGLKRNVSHRTLIRLEVYKLIKHIMNIEEYQPFKLYW